LAERVQEASDHRVGGGNVAVVGRAILRTKRLGGGVWRGGLVDVKRKEEWLRLMAGDPTLSDLSRLITLSLGAAHAQKVRIDVDVVVPEVEAAFDPCFAAQHDCRNRSSR